MLRNNTVLYNINALYNNKKKIHWFFRQKIAILSSFLVGAGQSESQFKRTNGPRFPRRPFPLKYSRVVSDWANVSRFKCSMRPRKSPSYRMEKGSSRRCNDLEGAGCDKCGERRNTWEKGGDESDRFAHGMKMRSGRKKERCSRRWEGERVRTRQLPTRPKTAIKRVGKQTTFPFCRSRSD